MTGRQAQMAANGRVDYLIPFSRRSRMTALVVRRLPQLRSLSFWRNFRNKVAMCAESKSRERPLQLLHFHNNSPFYGA